MIRADISWPQNQSSKSWQTISYIITKSRAFRRAVTAKEMLRSAKKPVTAHFHESYCCDTIKLANVFLMQKLSESVWGNLTPASMISYQDSAKAHHAYTSFKSVNRHSILETLSNLMKYNMNIHLYREEKSLNFPDLDVFVCLLLCFLMHWFVYSTYYNVFILLWHLL